jgi:lipoprotein NlpI
VSRTLPALTFLLLGLAAAPADSADDLLRQAEAAWKNGERDRAVELAGKAVAADPKAPRSYLLRGSMLDAQGKHAEAVADFTRAIELDPKGADAYDRRGSAEFKRGHVKEAVADFDRFIALRPDEANGHWRRGIALYYAGRFDDGRKQFEGYEKVDTNDVENAVWHFLCNARANGIDKARKEVLKIGQDRRVPMSQVYALFKGEIKPEDVLTAAEAGNVSEAERKQRLFYAHLYLGLYYEVSGDTKKARSHLELAADKYRIGHYMGDVARVHVMLLDRKEK